MNRNEKIEIILENCLWDWDDSLRVRDLLWAGFKGVQKYTEDELDGFLKQIDKNRLKVIKEIVKQKKLEQGRNKK